MRIRYWKIISKAAYQRLFNDCIVIFIVTNLKMGENADNSLSICTISQIYALMCCVLILWFLEALCFWPSFSAPCVCHGGRCGSAGGVWPVCQGRPEAESQLHSPQVCPARSGWRANHHGTSESGSWVIRIRPVMAKWLMQKFASDVTSFLCYWLPICCIKETQRFCSGLVWMESQMDMLI